MQFFRNFTIKVSRLKTTTGNLREYVATATADADVQPVSGGVAQQIDAGVYGKLYVAYVDTDVAAERGDRVKDQDGVTYDVTDVITRDFGAFPYKEIRMKRQ